MEDRVNTTRPRVLVFTTGGTIASRLDPATNKVAPAATGEELLAIVPAIADVAAAQVVEFAHVASWNVTPAMMFHLAERVNQELSNPDVDGAVVTHGTDTMEESSFMLDLLMVTDKPVVFVGAQLNLSDVSPDGPRNLFDAVRVAASPDARGKGVLVCFNGEINAARDVAKTHTTALQTFRSRDHGIIGQVDRDGVVFYRAPLHRARLVIPALDERVELVRLAAGADGRLIDAAVNLGARAVVVEGFGAGNVPGPALARIRAAVEAGVIVVVTSRCGEGRVQPVYGANGGGKDLVEAGAILSGDLSGHKMRLLLMAALPIASTRHELLELIRQISP
jgi:L-asparaginase